MYAIYEVLNNKPSGRPQDKWADWSLFDGRICEKRLLGTRGSKDEAEKEAQRAASNSENHIYWASVD